MESSGIIYGISLPIVVINRDVIFTENKLQEKEDNSRPETTTVKVEKNVEDSDPFKAILEYKVEELIEEEASEIRRST
ncbi:hypothetical protein PanWU01x14_039720, partial [Parasponia andersonii]